MASRKVPNPTRTWPRKPWHRLPDDALLAIPVGRLDLRWEDTPLVSLEHQLRRELTAIGITHFHPFVYLGDEWFSPMGVGAISVPFFLADPRLKRLARHFFYELEGGTRSSFMRLLRHEAGHAFDHAYALSQRADWRRVFGDPEKAYRSRAFRADPTSPDFVQHLDRTYAQAHPVEDFAETFATILTPQSRWESHYRKCPGARAKLQFVTEIIARFGGKPPRFQEATLPFQADRMRRTVGDFFAAQIDAPKVVEWERRLRLVFPANGDGSAHDFLKIQKDRFFSQLDARRPKVAERLSREYDQVVKQARRLGLGAPEDRDLASLRLTAFLTDSLTH